MRLLYFPPHEADTPLDSPNLYLRSALAPGGDAADPSLTPIDRNLPIVGMKTMPQKLNNNAYLDRILSTLSTAFAALATLPAQNVCADASCSTASVSRAASLNR